MKTIILAIVLLLLPLTASAQSYQSIPASLIFAMAQSEIEKAIDSSDGSEYKVECLTRFPEVLQMPAGALDMKAELVGQIRYNAPVQVRVDIKVNGVRQMNLVTTWRVKKILMVIVAARDLPSRTVLSDADVVFERREVDRIDDIILEIKDIMGQETKRALTVGTVITKSMLGKPQLVKSGDNITIVSIAGAVMVKATGQALQGGAAGDVIRVRNLASGKIILARVQDENTVVISVRR